MASKQVSFSKVNYKNSKLKNVLLTKTFFNFLEL